MSSVHFTFVMQPWLGRMHRRIRDATILSTQRGFCGLGIAASGSSCLETQDCSDTFLVHQWTFVWNMVYIYIRTYDISWCYIRKIRVFRDCALVTDSRIWSCFISSSTKVGLKWESKWFQYPDIGLGTLVSSQAPQKFQPGFVSLLDTTEKQDLSLLGQFLIGVVEGFLSGLWGYLTTDWCLEREVLEASEKLSGGRQVIFSRIKKCEAVPLFCVKDVLSHESCHEFRWCFMLRSSNINSDPIHRNQDSLILRKITSNLQIGKWSFSYCWHSCQNMSESYGISWGTSSGSFQRQHFTVLLCMDSTAEVWWAVTVWSSNPVAELQRWNLSVSQNCITSLDCVTLCYNLHQGWSFWVSPRFGKCDGHVFYTDTGSPGAEELRQARWSTPHGGGGSGGSAGAGLRSRESANSKGEQRPRWLALSQVRSHASDPQHHTI